MGILYPWSQQAELYRIFTGLALHLSPHSRSGTPGIPYLVVFSRLADNGEKVNIPYPFIKERGFRLDFAPDWWCWPHPLNLLPQRGRRKYSKRGYTPLILLLNEWDLRRRTPL
jgi:hypothetical protein